MRNLTIGDCELGQNCPVFIVAELSANHLQKYDLAVETLHAAKKAGADAVKLQTYTADTLTIDVGNEYFRIKQGTPWDGKTLYQLYQEAYTPWDWQPKLKQIADDLGLVLFSTPFDKTAVDFLEEMGVLVYKVASFELVDIPLIEYVASKGKPMIMSTGMATQEEVADAIHAARGAGANELALLKCTSAYPSRPEEMNLKMIPHLSQTFGVLAGLSDHTLEINIPTAAVALGATIIEKHFTLKRSYGGPDASFSLEPQEFSSMVESIRLVEKALGMAHFHVTEGELKSKVFRKSLFIIKDMKTGDTISEENIRSIRPGYGIMPKYMKDVLGKKINRNVKKGSPLSWDFVQ